jgi:hypothetical protein
MTSFSTGQGTTLSNQTTRSTIEVNHGLTEHFEMAAYADFTRNGTSEWGFTAARFQGHFSLFEKGELPVDLGGYFEIGLPQVGATKLEIEARGIIEKDVGQWTISVNPILEYELEEEYEIEADGRIEHETEWELEKAYAVSLRYRIGENWRPGLAVFGDLAPPDKRILLIHPTLDYKISANWLLGGGLGIGATEPTEKKVGSVKLEYEF